MKKTVWRENAGFLINKKKMRKNLHVKMKPASWKNRKPKMMKRNSGKVFWMI